jgi:peroxiredoxin
MRIKEIIYFIGLIVGITVITVQCTAQPQQGYQINIEVVGIQDTATIVGYHFGNQRLILDTARFVNNTIQISGTESLKKGIYFLYSPNFYLKVDTKSGYKAMEVSGSLDNELFAHFQNRMGQIQKEQELISGQLSEVTPEDSLVIIDQLRGLGLTSELFRDSLISAHPKTYFASFLKIIEGVKTPDFKEVTDEAERRMIAFKYYKGHYFDVLDNADELMRTPVIHGFVMKYFDELVVRQADSVNIEIKNWLDRFDENPEAFRYWLMTLYKKYQESKIMGMDGVMVFLSDQYFLTDRVTFMTAEQKTEIEEEIKFIRPNLIGRLAPKMNLLDTAKRPYSLDLVNQKYLIYFFYDPDCGHCKKKTPILKDAYADLKKIGAEVVAVCTTTDMDKWKTFIKEQKLDWINLGDPLYKDNFRMEYNVRTTPQVYVLDQQRKIIAKKLDVEQLVDFLENYELFDQTLGEQ